MLHVEHSLKLSQLFNSRITICEAFLKTEYNKSLNIPPSYIKKNLIEIKASGVAVKSELKHIRPTINSLFPHNFFVYLFFPLLSD